MTSFQANASQISVDLVLASISNTDTLVRDFKAKCEENTQLKKNLQSLSETSGQITTMYQQEKNKCNQLLAEKERLEERIKQMNTKIKELQHRQVNQDTLHGQTMAEMEERLANATHGKQCDFMGLCRQFVAQGQLLQQHDVTVGSTLRRKQKEIVAMLKQHGEKIEDVKVTSKRAKMASMATMTEADMPISPSNASIERRKRTADKATMHRMSTATRATCTSAFIRKIDVGTSTEPWESIDPSEDVRNAFEHTLSHPALLSPIKPIRIAPRKKTQNKRTITPLQNVVKEIDYRSASSRAASPLQPAFNLPTKEEHVDSMSSTDSSLPLSPLGAAPGIINPAWEKCWKLMGDLLYTCVGNGRIFNADAMAFYGHHDRGSIAKTLQQVQDELAKLNGASGSGAMHGFRPMAVPPRDISCSNAQSVGHNFIADDDLLMAASDGSSSPSPPFRRRDSSTSTHTMAINQDNQGGTGTFRKPRIVSGVKRSYKNNELFGSPKKIKIRANVSRI